MSEDRHAYVIVPGSGHRGPYWSLYRMDDDADPVPLGQEVALNRDGMAWGLNARTFLPVPTRSLTVIGRCYDYVADVTEWQAGVWFREHFPDATPIEGAYG